MLGGQLESAVAEQDPNRRGASLPAGHPVLHRPLTVHLDHAGGQQIRDGRRQDPVVSVEVGGVGADRRRHELDDVRVDAGLGRQV